MSRSFAPLWRRLTIVLDCLVLVCGKQQFLYGQLPNNVSVYVTVHAKLGHPAKTGDMPFLVPFISTEFCAYYHIFVIFIRRYSDIQDIQNLRMGAMKYSVYAVCLRLRSNCLCAYLCSHTITRKWLPFSLPLVLFTLTVSLLQISKAKLLVALFLFVSAHSLQIV